MRLAGVMGGANTEIADADGEHALTTEVVIEAAHFDAISIARTAHRPQAVLRTLPSASSGASTRRPPPLPRSARWTCWSCSRAAPPRPGSPRSPRPTRPDHRHAGEPPRPGGRCGVRPRYVVRRLQEVGCDVYGQDELIVTVPSWRPDLGEPNDLAEEVVRLEGYENLPSTLPTPPSGRCLTDRQRLHRRIGRVLAGAGYVEALRYPFIGYLLVLTSSAWTRTTSAAVR
ncbi:Phenylalanine--tRNA ligase beta subunit OS=Streptomyces microflavus OX=1919 GN=pheT PE=3 SV=1 [Streptomyces microflavus]